MNSATNSDCINKTKCQANIENNHIFLTIEMNLETLIINIIQQFDLLHAGMHICNRRAPQIEGKKRKWLKKRITLTIGGNKKIRNKGLH